jgi:hypothetical protein
MSTPALFNTANKCPTIQGVGGRTSTVINWTGATNAVALTFDCYAWPTGGGVSPGFGVRDIRLVNTVAAGTTVGLQVGLVGGHGAAGFLGENVDVIGFNQNLVVGDNTWDIAFIKGNFDLPGTNNLYLASTLSNSGESIGFTDTIFSNSVSGNSGYKASCIVNGLGGLLTFKGGSLDNCQFVQSGGTGSTVFLGVNFEDPLATNNTNPYMLISSGSVEQYGGTLLQDASSGTIPTAFVSISAGTFKQSGVWASNARAVNINRVALSGSGSLDLSRSTPDGSNIGKLFSGSTSGHVQVLDQGTLILNGGPPMIWAQGSQPVVIGGGTGSTTDMAVINQALNAYLLYVTDAGAVVTKSSTIDDGSGNMSVGAKLTLTGTSAGPGAAACIKSDKSIGYCSSVVGAGGTCTCN